MLTKVQKVALDELIIKGHRRFGKVAERRPYSDDDDRGEGGGAAQLLMEHPLLATMPIGAPSDLTFDTVRNSMSILAAEKVSDQLNPQLRKALENTLGKELSNQPKIKVPEARSP